MESTLALREFDPTVFVFGVAANKLLLFLKVCVFCVCVKSGVLRSSLLAKQRYRESEQLCVMKLLCVWACGTIWFKKQLRSHPLPAVTRSRLWSRLREGCEKFIHQILLIAVHIPFAVDLLLQGGHPHHDGCGRHHYHRHCHRHHSRRWPSALLAFPSTLSAALL